MNRWIRTSILAAAVATVPLFAASATGQYRINEDGRALDASNRIGSGGVNPSDSHRRVGEQVGGNDIVTGNVSGGRHFRGGVPYTDPQAFRGNTAGVSLDNFIRSASGPDARLAEQVRPFYGAGRAVAPPAGYVETAPGSGAYIPPQTVVTRSAGDVRIGVLDLNNPNVALPQPGELLLSGQVDPSSGQTYITASPTAGIRTFGANELSGTSNTQYSPIGMRLDQNAIERMREELNRDAGITTAGVQQPAASGAPGGAAPAPGAVPTPGATAVAQQPVLQPNTAQPIDTTLNAAAGAGSGQGVSHRLAALPSPERQSALYAEMIKTHQELLNNPNVTDEQRARRFNQLQAQAAKDEAARTQAAGATPGQIPPPGTVPPPPDAGAPGAQPGAQPPIAAGPTADAAPGRDRPAPDTALKDAQKELALKRAPLKVPSLSEGMKGKQLSELMKSAEQAMRDGKFTAALDSYDDAERVVPNNPLVNLGRAHAELGASYYARAEAHLRELFTSHPELLVAQYDLTNMLGEQRLQTVVRDLKEIARKDQKEPRPHFLLAYIAYNTGREPEAEAHLDLADRRTGGQDPFYKLLRNNWSLPNKAAAPAGGNK